MKRVCNRPIQIDAANLCYETQQTILYDKLCGLELGECLVLDEFRLYRTEGRYFDNVYSIKLWDGTRDIEWGYVKFNIARGDKDCNTHTNGSRKVWLSIKNETLYSDDINYLTYIDQRLGFVFHNVTNIDLCLDTSFSVSTLVKLYLHNKNVTTILNGRRVIDRDGDRPEISYTYSGSLNKQHKYQTVTIKQRKAIKDKCKGVTMQTYDKAAEIKNSSDKQYILEHYDNPNKLYRTEVHLNSEDIKSYIERRGIQYTPLIMFDEALLEEMFFHFLNSVIRFQCSKFDVSWMHILGRS